ncbi:hypothetical protein ACFPTO_01845 [Paraburkholderia denitrificans]|uniref:Uncharacterized protein n=1 Tax=Paraburkholderia denitrificans TaxID=694025 RepID=A0ABW0J3E9_9BURK
MSAERIEQVRPAWLEVALVREVARALPPEPDVIEQACRLRGMDRANLAVSATMRGVSIEDYTREVVAKSKKPAPVIDRQYIERARRGYRVRR